ARVRRSEAKAGRLELQAVIAVLDPVALAFEELAGMDGRQIADDRDDAAAAGGLDTQHSVPVVRVMKRDPLDDPGQRLGHYQPSLDPGSLTPATRSAAHVACRRSTARVSSSRGSDSP